MCKEDAEAEAEARYEEMGKEHVFWDFHSEKTDEEADARMKDGWKAYVSVYLMRPSLLALRCFQSLDTGQPFRVVMSHDGGAERDPRCSCSASSRCSARSTARRGRTRSLSLSPPLVPAITAPFGFFVALTLVAVILSPES